MHMMLELVIHLINYITSSIMMQTSILISFTRYGTHVKTGGKAKTLRGHAFESQHRVLFYIFYCQIVLLLSEITKKKRKNTRVSALKNTD